MGVAPQSAEPPLQVHFLLPLSVRRRRDHDANNGGRGDIEVGDASVVGAEDFETIIYSTSLLCSLSFGSPFHSAVQSEPQQINMRRGEWPDEKGV